MSETNSVILQANGDWWQFCRPLEIISTNRVEEVSSGLQTVETAVTQHHLYAAGFLSYEAGAAFGLDTYPHQPGDPPLLWFGLYRQPERIAPPQPPAKPAYQLSAWQPAVAAPAYYAAIDCIKTHIAAGLTYQVNYTFPLHAQFQGDAWALFCQLAQAQQAAYAAFVDIGSHAICSASPELFFQLDGDRLLSKPMKGTAVRGRTLTEDNANTEWLRHSAKNRAENVMIVDMIRNDVGRVAEIGSVQVPRLFAVERYPTVLQMTSTVTARARAPFSQIMASMFPCASITGAPKHRTMQIIKELEGRPRGLYTGAIGYLTPERPAALKRQAQFNVAIRTVVVNRQQGQAAYGVGGGIVWDSQAAEEYEECRIKARVLTQPRPVFHLLESLLWQPDTGYFLLAAHVARLLASAQYFGMAVTEAAVSQHLLAFAQTLTAPAKVRLLLAQSGELRLTVAPLTTLPEPARVGLAGQPVQSDTVWLYHKTTQRQLYDDARASRPDCDEALLWNERGELTEASSANIVLELNGELLTPPLDAGLLAGTYRGWLLENGRIREHTLIPADLPRASHIWLINSVRKWRRAVWVDGNR